MGGAVTSVLKLGDILVIYIVKNLFCLLFCLILFSCESQQPERPDHLIPEKEFVSILADIHTAEAQIESTIAYPDTALMVFNHLQEEIWKKHGVTKYQFRETYNYYTTHVPEMDKLYEIVTDTLLAREAGYAKKPKPQPVPDPELVEAPDSIRFQEGKEGPAGTSGFKPGT